jgi:hypothetical protein
MGEREVLFLKLEDELKRRLIAAFLLSLLLSGCAPSQAEIQKAIAQTQTAVPTVLPTSTIAQTVTATLSADQLEAAWTTFEQTIVSLITSVEGVRVVKWVRLTDGVIDIKLQTKWQAADSQPKVSYDIIRQLSGFCTNTMEAQIAAYTGVTAPSIRITTLSVDELYVFESLTTFDQCVTMGFGDLNFADWQKEANIKQIQ